MFSLINVLDSRMSEIHHSKVVVPSSRDALPDDPELLKDMLWQVLMSNEELANQVSWFKRMMWGRKSEKLQDTEGQTSLFGEPEENTAKSADDAADDKQDGPPPKMPKDTVKTGRGGKRGKKRGTFKGGTVPENTPVHSSHFGLEGLVCSVCGGVLSVIGTDTRQRVEYVPGHFIIEEAVVESGVCPDHREVIVTAEGPQYALAGSVLGNHLLSSVIVDKYADNIPLRKQSKRFARKGVHIVSSTLSRNVIASAALLQHVVAAMRDELLDSQWLQGDATGLPVLIGNLGQTHSATLWVYSNGESAVFDVTMTKHGDFPAEFLAGFTGIWLCDGASDYNQTSNQPGVDRAGCWSHARRYLFDARNDDVAILEAVHLVRDLFMTERIAMTLDFEERQKHRDQHAQPIIDKLRTWLLEQKDKPRVIQRPKSPFAKAVGYLDRQWGRLIMFLDHPEIAVHNNRSELLLRTSVIGRRNWLFAGSPQGATASAIHYSIVATCMLLGIDPMEYLEDVLPRLPNMKRSQVATVTPAKWAATRREAPVAT